MFKKFIIGVCSPLAFCGTWLIKSLVAFYFLFRLNPYKDNTQESSPLALCVTLGAREIVLSSSSDSALGEKVLSARVTQSGTFLWSAK